MTTVLLAVIAGSPSLAPNWLSAALRVPALRSVGKFSYAMYVFHIPLSILVGAPLLPALKRLGSGYPVWYAIWIAACSYLAAMASYHLLEKHFLRAKRYFVPAKTAVARA
jgi:peptidoglycan/LPS O-acetylase OafA/YrhL